MPNKKTNKKTPSVYTSQRASKRIEMLLKRKTKLYRKNKLSNVKKFCRFFYMFVFFSISFSLP